MRVLRRFKEFCLYGPPVNLIHGGQRRQEADSKGQLQCKLPVLAQLLLIKPAAWYQTSDIY